MKALQRRSPASEFHGSSAKLVRELQTMLQPCFSAQIREGGNPIVTALAIFQMFNLARCKSAAVPHQGKLPFRAEVALLGCYGMGIRESRRSERAHTSSPRERRSCVNIMTTFPSQRTSTSLFPLKVFPSMW